MREWRDGILCQKLGITEEELREDDWEEREYIFEFDEEEEDEREEDDDQ